MTKPSSEFDNVDDEQAYQRWFRKEVRTSLADTNPPIPHATAMVELDDIILNASPSPSGRGPG